MKKIKIFALLASLLLLCGCVMQDNGFNFGDDSDRIVQDGELKIQTEPLYGIGDYYIIRADLASDIEKDAMIRLKNAVKNALDIDLTSSTDWIGEWEGGAQLEHDKEIIIGDTERDASRQAMKGLAFGDFVIKKTGDKIVIVGGSDSATAKAVDFFIEHFINVYGGCLDIPAGEGYIYSHDYMFESLTIDGVDISEFYLYAVPGVDITGVSEYIAENVYGVLIPVAEEMTSSRKYIIFDNSGLIANGFSIEVKYDGNLYVTGSADTAQYAIEYFKHDFFEALERKSTNCNIAIQDNYTGNSSKMPDYMTEEEIIARLEEASVSEGFLSGEQGGSSATPDYIIENFKTATGKTPDVLCIDLLSYGLHADELTYAELSEVICQLSDYCEQGGIVAISAYFENPTGGWELGDKVTGSLGSADNWNALVTDGTDLNKKFRRQLDVVAEILKAVCDNGMTVIFKPFEGPNMDKYWYSTSGAGADPESYAALWRYVYGYITSKGCSKLIWQYTPYVTEGATGLFDAYPGDEYVDIIGGVWQDVGVKTVSEDFAFGLARHSKSAGVMTLSVSSRKISSSKEKQLSLFNCRDLAEAIVSAKKNGIRIPAVVTFGTSSSPAWLGEGGALPEHQ